MSLNFDPTALVGSVTPPTRMMIGGRSVEAASGRTFATHNPATGEELAQVAEGEQEDIDRAVASARDAFDNGPWGKMAPADRRNLLKRQLRQRAYVGWWKIIKLWRGDIVKLWRRGIIKRRWNIRL